MLQSRHEAAERKSKIDIQSDPHPTAPDTLLAPDEQEGGRDNCELPDQVIVALLEREHLLTKAKLHCLSYDHEGATHSLKTLGVQLRQVNHVERPMPVSSMHS